MGESGRAVVSSDAHFYVGAELTVNEEPVKFCGDSRLENPSPLMPFPDLGSFDELVLCSTPEFGLDQCASIQNGSTEGFILKLVPSGQGGEVWTPKAARPVLRLP